MNKFVLSPEDGDRIIDQYGVLWVYDRRSKTWINMGFLDVYGNVSSSSDGLVYPILFEALDSLDPDRFNGLRILDNAGASFYYFRSTDSTIKFRFEEHLGEKRIRAEVEQGTLSRKFREIRCQGPKGKRGDKGEQGISGVSAPNEPTHKLDIDQDGLVQIEVGVSTPIDSAVSLRLLRNQIQIAEFLVHQDGEVEIAFADGYSLKEGTTYNIYIEDNVLYAVFELDGDLTGIWTFKARQMGPKGPDGEDGNWFLSIIDTEIQDENLISNDAIFEIGKSRSDISYNISTVGDNICAHGLVPSNPSNFKFILGSTLFMSAKYMASNCRDIVRWEYERPETTTPDLNMPEWTPTECCPHTRITGDDPGIIDPDEITGGDITGG